MVSGIQIRNNDSFFQIDSEFRNLASHSKGTIATATAMLNASFVTITVNGLTGFPVVAVRNSDGAMAYVANFSGSSATIHFAAKGPVGTSIQYYIFCPPGEPPVAGLFEVRDESGNLCFSPHLKYMKVVGSLTGSASTSGADTQTITMPAGKTYAVMCDRRIARNRVINQSPSPPFIDYWSYTFYGFFKVVSNVITISTANTAASSFGNFAPPEVNFPGTGFILDVTGF
jgi:hypothetical protein